MERGQEDEAEELYRSALRIRRAVLGPRHPLTLSVTNNLAFLYRRQARWDEAEPLLREALEGYAEALGPDHPNTLVVRSNLGEMQHERGRVAEAERTHAATIEGFARALPEGHWLHGLALMRHGVCLRDLQRHAEAEAELLGAHALLVEALGRENLRSRRCAEELVDLYEAWEKAEPGQGHGEGAERWRREDGR